MVACEEGRRAWGSAALQMDEKVQHFPCVGATIAVVPQKDHMCRSQRSLSELCLKRTPELEGLINVAVQISHANHLGHPACCGRGEAFVERALH